MFRPMIMIIELLNIELICQIKFNKIKHFRYKLVQALGTGLFGHKVAR
jgi:hypothetical protein